ncbi:hypothetical protein NQ314_003399 [Rhamnusium bicolor]|uniref:Uncharacterized protein n=1 Tax=Rhamnusium bicolor TaxID=1586634 RepID=A0AAV8ZM32_9CUCU|nr:hypothetical protein NQ314_003399 [Rhamnusium bicolor]
MIGLKLVHVFTFLALCTIIAADRSYSIKDSQVPSIQYEVDAVDCLSEAYVLYPNNIDNKLLEAFSKLYENRHKITGGWNAVLGCQSCYNPKSTQFVEITVKDDGGQSTTVRIFN